MIILEDYDVKKLKRIFEAIDYDIELVESEEFNGTFIGLSVVLSEEVLYFLFMSDTDSFDYDVNLDPYQIYLTDTYEYKQGFIEDCAVRELIEIFKNNDYRDLKILIDEELYELKIIKNKKMIFNYYL
jgi:hypothetical protein